MGRFLPLAMFATASAVGAQPAPGDPFDTPAPLVDSTLDPVLEPVGDPPPSTGLQLPGDEPVAARELVRLVFTPGSFADRCPDVTIVQQRVREHLGYDPFGEPSARVVLLLLDGPVGGDPARARLEILDPQLRPLGSRVIEADDGCDELVATAALQISIALDPLATTSPVPATSLPTNPTTATPPPTTPPTAPVEARFEPVLGDLRTLVSVDVHVSMLLVPGDPTLGVALGAGARWDYWSLRGEVRGDFADGENTGISAFPVLLSAVPCAHIPFFDLDTGDGTLEVTGCLTATSGVVPVVGAFSGVGVYVGGGGRAGLDWHFADDTVVRVFSQIEGAVLRTSFGAGDGDTFSSSPVNLVFGVGIDIGDW